MDMKSMPAHTTHRAGASETQADELVLQGRMRDIGRKLLVLSGKGGVGKSTVAVNLAVALAMRGKAVGLLDVDIHGPSVPKLTALEDATIQSDGGALLPVRLTDNLGVMSIGFLLRSKADSVIWRGPLKFKLIREFLKDVAWGRLDYLVVDCPPGTGDEPLSVAQLVGSPAAAVLVTTPQDLSISDVRRCVSFCKQLSLAVLGIVENMSGFVCPQCGARIDPFKSGGGETLARETGVPFLGRIPLEPQIVLSGDEGTPFVKAHPQLASAKAFADMVGLIEDAGWGQD